MIKRAYRHQRNRQAATLQTVIQAASLVAVMSLNLTKLRLTFSAPVTVSGIPTGITRQAAGAGPQLVPTAVTVVSATIVDVTYAASLATSDVVTIPAGVTQIRGVTGGMIAAAVKTF